MEDKKTEELEKQYVKLIKDIRLNMIADISYADEEIISRINETPEIIKIRDKMTDTNLFMQAVLYDRMKLARYLAEQGADIHYESKSDWFSGNALNGAKSPEMAEWLLSLGLKIEKNLVQNINERLVPYDNPAIAATLHELPEMMRYWLNKEKDLFKDEPDFIDSLFATTVKNASFFNNNKMLTALISDDELYPYLKNEYSEGDTWNLKDTIKLNKRGLKTIEAEELQDRKNELLKILNARAKEFK